MKNSLCVLLLRWGNRYVHAYQSNRFSCTIFSNKALSRTEGLHFQISGVCWYREDAEGVGVAKSAFPALHGDDSRARRDEFQGQRVSQPKPDSIVHLQ